MNLSEDLIRANEQKNVKTLMSVEGVRMSLFSFINGKY